MATVYSLSTAQNYRGVVRAVESIAPQARDEMVEAAVHAVNAVKKYVKSGFLRVQYQPNGVENIVVVKKKEIVILPAVETFLLFVQVDQALNFLTSLTGIGTIVNRWPSEENPF